jgi:hypothetical protein
MDKVKRVALFVAKALFCLVLAWALILNTLSYVLLYFHLSLPVGLLAIPGAVALFMFFTKLEKPSR